MKRHRPFHIRPMVLGTAARRQTPRVSSLRRPLSLMFLMTLACAAGCARAEPEEVELKSEPRASAPAPGPRFVTRREARLDAKPEWVRAADLDGDGYDELAVATIAPGSLRVRIGGPEGLAREELRIPVGDYPLAPVALRIDRAGVGGSRVFAVASRAEREVLLIDPFAPEPGVPLRALPLPSTPRALTAGDLGADGTEELVVAGDGRTLTLFAADGTHSAHELAAELPRCLLIAADGAGLWLGFQDTRALHFRSWSDGVLATDGPVVELGGIPRALCEADLDGDGELELIVVGGDHTLWVFGWGEPSGGEAWRAGTVGAPLVWKTEAVPVDVAARDLDGDGRAELVLLHSAGLTWSVWSGFTREGPRQRVSAYAGQTPLSLALADGDGDGELDLFIANRDSACVSFAAGVGASFARAPLTRVGGFPNSLCAADLVGDGRPEVLVLDSKDDTLSVLRNDGGALVPALSIPVGPSPRAVSAHDLTGDGRPEVALLTIDSAGARLVLLARTETGGLAPRADRPPLAVGRSARDLLALDLDGDGLLDLLVADDEGDRLRWYLNAGDLEFTLGGELALGAGPCALARIELDGDAGPELAVALGGPGPETGLAFLDVRAGPEGVTLVELGRLVFPDAPADLAVADFDGDGRDDVAAVGAELRVFLRESGGGAGFRALRPAPIALVPRNSAAGDLDGDGRADLVAACQLGHIVDAWVARTIGAEGEFALVRQDGIGAGVGPFDLALADIDGDGLLDVVVANAHGDDVSVVVQRPR